ncbi:MAG: hypothetical protein JWN23_1864 [Rhodocyclales bacterium]|nr:hypothetical protein [Rhodocyclales bacterium]
MNMHIEYSRQHGFSLIEMIVSLVLVGILSGIMSVFLQVPMQSYFVSRQRLDLSDSIEPAMRHMDQDLRQALPNSVRPFTVAGVQYIEFLATRANGRYRLNNVGGPAGACAGGDQLAAPALDNCFTTIGQIVARSNIAPGADYVVIDNQGATCPSLTSAYCNGAVDGPNKSRITAYTPSLGAPLESRLNFNNFALPSSPANLFYIVSGPVSYACDLATGQLLRYSGYPITAVPGTPPVAATQSVIVAHLSACSISYVPASTVLNQGLVTVALALSNNVPGQGPETVNLLVQIPVSKTQ